MPEPSPSARRRSWALRCAWELQLWDAAWPCMADPTDDHVESLLARVELMLTTTQTLRLSDERVERLCRDGWWLLGCQRVIRARRRVAA